MQAALQDTLSCIYMRCAELCDAHQNNRVMLIGSAYEAATYVTKAQHVDFHVLQNNALEV